MSSREEARAYLGAAAQKMEEAAGLLYAVSQQYADEARSAALAAMDGTNDSSLMECLGYIDRLTDMTQEAAAAANAAAAKLSEEAARQ